MTAPAYLDAMKDRFDEDPHGANLEWFRGARFGLFMHWGLHATYGEGCPYLINNNVPIPEYKDTMNRFTGEKFDADFITDLALEAEMKYVTFVTRHHDSFSLWDSRTSEFSRDYCSMAAPAKRDFVAELADQCSKKGLGLFFYYSYGMDWVHPWYPTAESGIPWKRPRVDGYHKWQKGQHIRPYLDFVHGQITELLTNYGPIAGMWFDPVVPVYQRPDLFPVEETYALVRELQPHCLISFKTGATGTEDFIAPEEHSYDGPLKRWIDEGSVPVEYRRKIRLFWDRMVASGSGELCSQMETKGWGYVKDTERIDADEVMRRLAHASRKGFNLLLNTGPLFDGSIHPEAIATLNEVGRRIRTDGWPGVG